MKRLAVFVLIAVGLSLVNPVFAGGPKESHPCYEVADCKTKGSKKEFSMCVKANLEEANANVKCAEFRKDKKGYMEQEGIPGLESMFN
ncbi:MAG: hypothetical protein ABFR65_00105 [Pseudomonadota bacterium]